VATMSAYSSFAVLLVVAKCRGAEAGEQDY
jgi:hypothetical protein